MARRRGRPASNTRGGHNKKLDVPQDQALRDYLMMLAGAGTEANLAKVKNAASRLLYYESGNPTKTVSRRWIKAWMVHNNKHLKILKQKPLSAK